MQRVADVQYALRLTAYIVAASNSQDRLERRKIERVVLTPHVAKLVQMKNNVRIFFEFGKDRAKHDHVSA